MREAVEKRNQKAKKVIGLPLLTTQEGSRSTQHVYNFPVLNLADICSLARTSHSRFVLTCALQAAFMFGKVTSASK